MTKRDCSNEQRGPLVVCLTGSESTGKTTLARALAKQYRAPLVEEAARAYLAKRHGYGPDDVLAIARRQLRIEQVALAERPRLLVCDTDLLVIRIWWEVRFGSLPEWLEEQLRLLTPRLYLLTAPDFPWQPDPLRESGGDRADLHRRYRQRLEEGRHPYVELGGARAARLNVARRCIDRLLARRVHEST